MDSDLKDLLKKARQAFDTGEYKECIDKCEELVQISSSASPANSKLYTALVLKGTAMSILSNHVDAMNVLKEATRLFPEQPLAWQAILSLPYTDFNSSMYWEAVQKANSLLPEDKAEEINKKAVDFLPPLQAIQIITDYMLKGAKHPVNLLKKLADLWIRWESETILARYNKQRYSIASGPKETLKDRITLSVQKESKLVDVLSELYDWGQRDYADALGQRLYVLGEVEKLKSLLEKEPELKLLKLNVVDDIDFEVDCPEAKLYTMFRTACLLKDANEKIAACKKAIFELSSCPFLMPKRIEFLNKQIALSQCLLGKPGLVDQELIEKDAEVAIAVIQAFKQLLEWKEALSIARMRPGIIPRNDLAWLFYHVRDWKQASETIEDDALLTALLQWQLENYLKAFELMEDLKDPLLNRFRGHYKWRVAKDDINAAVKCYMAALEHNSRDIEAAVGLAEIYAFQGNLPYVNDFLQPFISDNPLYALFWKLLGISTLDDDPNLAAQYFQAALRGTSMQYSGEDASIPQTQSTLTAYLADAYMLAGKTMAVYRILHRSPRKDYLQLADCCVRLGKYYEALQILDSSEPDDVNEIWNDLKGEAMAGWATDCLKRGIQSPHQLIDELSRCESAGFASAKTFGDFYKLAGKISETTRLYEDALKMASGPLERSRILCDLAILRSDTEMSLEAMELNADQWSFLAMSHCSRKKALHWACKAIQANKSCIPAWIRVLSLTDSAEDCVKYLNACIAECPSSHPLQYLRMFVKQSSHDLNNFVVAFRHLIGASDDDVTDDKLKVTRGEASSECPAYYTSIYEAYANSKGFDDEPIWLRHLVLSRLNTLTGKYQAELDRTVQSIIG